MKRNVIIALGVVLGLVLGGAPLLAGGQLETFDITAGTPAQFPGFIIANVIPIRWDARCIPVNYRVNNTLDPIPNPLGAAFLSVADFSAAHTSSMNSWNDIGTSFIDMKIVGTTSNPGLRRFDFVNELTARTAANFGAIASSPSVSLIADSTFNDGDDIDGDGDSDVSSSLTSCADADGDGDIEFPPGFYPAGTILDNDVQYNTKTSNGLRFTVADAAADNVTRSVDLEGVAVHELGHSHGLSHGLVNETSPKDGTGATMFPFIDTGDPASELAQRSLANDDIAWSSFVYPEGTASSGPAAKQRGDRSFNSRFSVLEGNVTHGVLGLPVAGASVMALKRDDDDDDDDGGGAAGATVVVEGFSGQTTLLFLPATGGLFFNPDPATALVNGGYSIPVPEGDYVLRIEATDGNPVSVASISFTAQVGNSFGLLNFNEEFLDNNEGAAETSPGAAREIEAEDGETVSGLDFTTNVDQRIASFGALNFIGFTGQPGGSLYAVQIPASAVTAAAGGNPLAITSGLFFTIHLDNSEVPTYARALLTTGTVSGSTATIDLKKPLRQKKVFLGQDSDFTPFYFKKANRLGQDVLAGIAGGAIENLFLVLELRNPAAQGQSATPPLIGLNATAPFGRSFLSSDGGATFNRVNNFNFMFALTTAAGGVDSDDDDD